MDDLQSPHDKCFQQIMQQPANAQSFFRQYLAPDWQARVDLDTLELQSGSRVTSAFKKLHSDILYRVRLCSPSNQGESAYLYTLIEHQSTPDRTMAIRLLQYKASILLPHAHDAYLPPIHTMVFYHGRTTPYPYELTLPFRDPEHARHTLQGPPQLIDVQQQPDTTLLQQDRAGLLSYFFKHVRDQDVLPALTALPTEFLRSITQDTSGLTMLETLMQYYQLIARAENPLQAFQQVAAKLEPEQREHIMTIGEALKTQGKQEGMQQGIQQGMQQGMQRGQQESLYKVASRLLHEGTDPQLIQRVTGLSADAVHKIATQSA
jgi:predicted transposase/invertase (TIGR01784 family)